MLEELAKAIEAYQAKWQQLIQSRNNKTFFEALKPTAVAWKVEDQADFDTRFKALRDLSDQIHMGWINERWLATLHLRDEALPESIRIVKLMQRRPGSSDPVGLDHLDFLISVPDDAKAVLSSEQDLKWSEEKNGEHCKWLSIWLAGTEAKLRRDTVLQVCADELLDYQSALTAGDS